MPAERGRGGRFRGASQGVPATSTQTPGSGGHSAALPPSWTCPRSEGTAWTRPLQPPRRLARRHSAPRTPPATRMAAPARRLPRTRTGGRGTESGAKGRALTSGSGGGGGSGPTSGAGPPGRGPGGGRCAYSRRERRRILRSAGLRATSGRNAGGAGFGISPREGGCARRCPQSAARPCSPSASIDAQHYVVWVHVFDRVRSGEKYTSL